MEKVDLELNVRYDLVISDLAFGPIEQDTLIKQFSDGRVCGRLVEPLCAKIFNDFECEVGGNGWDLRRKSTKKEQEVKTFTKRGCNLIPSGQIGKGRKYDQDEYHKYVKCKEWFLIIDICDFPSLSIIALKSEDILKKYPGTKKSKPKVNKNIFKTNKIINLGKLGVKNK